MRRDFSDLKLHAATKQQATLSNNQDIWNTPEGISVKPYFSKETVQDAEHLNFAAGLPPFLRGSYSTMYVSQPWVIRQYPKFSTAKECNAFYKNSLSAGQKELFINFRVKSNQTYNSNPDRTVESAGKSGIIIDSILDMEILFKNIPLDKTPVTMSTNGAVLPVIACYIAAAKKQGVRLGDLNGTIQNNLLNGFLMSNIDAPLSLKISEDVLAYTSKYMPKFKFISINDSYWQEAVMTADVDLAYTLANGIEYLRSGLALGLKIDKLAPKLSFFWTVGMDHFMEIAKMRTARVLWAKIIKQFNPKDPEAMVMHVHSQTSNWSLNDLDSLTNVSRTCIMAMAASLGGTQSLQTNAWDKDMPASNDFLARIVHNTQMYIQEETQITKSVDPWAGSYYVEYLTKEMTKKVWALIEEVEELGGMVKALETGVPKMRIEEASARKQAYLDARQDILVDENKFKTIDELNQTSLEVDNSLVEWSQREHLTTFKTNRNQELVAASLNALRICAEIGNGNLLELAVEAAENFATLGEVSDALEVHFKTHKTKI